MRRSLWYLGSGDVQVGFGELPRLDGVRIDLLAAIAGQVLAAVHQLALTILALAGKNTAL